MGEVVVADPVNGKIPYQGDTPTIQGNQSFDLSSPPLPAPGGSDRSRHARTEADEHQWRGEKIIRGFPPEAGDREIGGYRVLNRQDSPGLETPAAAEWSGTGTTRLRAIPQNWSSMQGHELQGK